MRQLRLQLQPKPRIRHITITNKRLKLLKPEFKLLQQEIV
jgi:hypothetical protein